MSTSTHQLDDDLHQYLVRFGIREPDVLRELREETASMEMARMQISPEQGQLMRMVVELIGAHKTLEIGTFTGYSALAVALALPPGGEIIACDVNEEWTSLARRYWEQAGVSDRIDLRIAPAEETLDALLADDHAGTFDFAFVDADKENYDVYYEKVLELLRPGGVLAVDNVFWGGRVLDPESDDESTRAIRALNEKIHGDDRVSLSMVPIGDGLTLVRRRNY